MDKGFASPPRHKTQRESPRLDITNEDGVTKPQIAVEPLRVYISDNLRRPTICDPRISSSKSIKDCFNRRMKSSGVGFFHSDDQTILPSFPHLKRNAGECLRDGKHYMV